ncbi:ABC-type nitrate/sulfonate/bicarbonate transport system substrate-binding protein [Bradyrhizobium sp. GM7.3]
MHVSIRLMPVVALAAFSVILAHAIEPEKTKLKIAVGSQILNYMPVELGVKLGSFKEEGLDVTVENFQAEWLKGSAGPDRRLCRRDYRLLRSYHSDAGAG